MTRARSARRRRAACGFSLLELVVAVCIIALLAAVAAERLIALRVDAERAALDATVGALRSAVMLEVARHVAKGRIPDLHKMAGSNPMDYLSELPDNYRGKFFGLDPSLAQEGYWYFDEKDRTLVYRVRFEEYFDSRLQGPARIRFAVVPVFDDVDRDGRFSPAVDVLQGMRLAPLDVYRWSDNPLF